MLFFWGGGGLGSGFFEKPVVITVSVQDTSDFIRSDPPAEFKENAAAENFAREHKEPTREEQIKMMDKIPFLFRTTDPTKLGR